MYSILFIVELRNVLVEFEQCFAEMLDRSIGYVWLCMVLCTASIFIYFSYCFG